MTDVKLAAALEVLVEQLNAQIREVSETKRTINGLRRRMGEDALFPNEDDQPIGISTIRPDQFYGKPLATAVQLFLDSRKQASSAEEILRALEQGGFDFRSLNWGEADRHRILAISLAKNNITFHKLPNGTFGMRSWYDETILKRSEKKPIVRRSRKQRKKGHPEKRVITRSASAETDTQLAVIKGADAKPKPGGQSD